jgi:hypothetical protein
MGLRFAPRCTALHAIAPKTSRQRFWRLLEWSDRKGVRVLKRLTILTCLLTFGLALGGCSKCGFWWDEWRQAPNSCKSDLPK